MGSVASKWQDLYSINDINVRNNQGVLNYAELNDVRLTAQAIANWLLQIPLKPGLVREEFITNFILEKCRRKKTNLERWISEFSYNDGLL